MAFRAESDLDCLRRRIRRLEGAGAGADADADAGAPLLHLGLAGIDRALPWGGLPLGGLHEIAGPPGDGAATGFAAMLLGRLTADARAAGRQVLWCRLRQDRQEAGLPYGPGLGAFGLAAERLLLVEARRPADLLWALEEGLRCPGLAAVLGEGVAPGMTTSRRLQLAAAAGGVPALLLFRTVAGAGASAALTRWQVAAAGGLERPRWRLALRRCRGGPPGDWLVEWRQPAGQLALAA